MARAKEAKGDEDEANASNPDCWTDVGVEVEEPKAGASPVAGYVVANSDGDCLLEKRFWPLMDAKGEEVDAYAINPL